MTVVAQERNAVKKQNGIIWFFLHFSFHFSILQRAVRVIPDHADENYTH